METAVIIAVVALAAAYIARSFYLKFKGQPTGGGCGCSGCGCSGSCSHGSEKKSSRLKTISSSGAMSIRPFLRRRLRISIDCAFVVQLGCFSEFIIS